MTQGETVKVVCAIVHDEHSRILLGRRKPGLVRAGQWELPGGKVKPGESVELAIARELQEEMKVETKSAKVVGSQIHQYPDLSIELIGVVCTLKYLPNTSSDHDALHWVHPDDLSKYLLSEADSGLIRKVLLGD